MDKIIKIMIGCLILISISTCKKEKPTEEDTQPPTVSIVSPYPGQELKQKQDTVIADATDNKGVSKVEIYIDGQLKSSFSAPPYQYIWDLTGYPNRSTHSIYAKAYDKVNNVGNSSTISVKVINRDTLTGENTSAQEIPDYGNGGVIEKTITISGAPQGAVTGWVKVEINIEDYYPDYDCIGIVLTNPQGAQVGVGDDSGGFPLIKEFPSQFSGQNPNGTWKLTIGDVCPDTIPEGKFNSWKIWVEWKF
jgi:hypothetical protein